MDNAEGILKLVTDLVATWGVRVVGALAVLIIGFMTARIIRSWTVRLLGRAQLNPTLRPFLATLVYYTLLLILGIAVLGLFGVPTTSFIAVLGAAGFAVGLALQGTLSNFASGVMLLVFQPFKVGDFVEAGGVAGTVREIGVFSSMLFTPDNTQIVLPNATIWGHTIRNFTGNDTRRNDMTIGIGYGDNIDKARTAILDVLTADDRVLTEPEPVVVVSGLGESSVDLAVKPWCRTENYWTLRADLMQRIKETLDANQISIPFPQRDLHVIQDDSSALPSAN
jgi:small conductance mechanosensitive channel